MEPDRNLFLAMAWYAMEEEAKSLVQGRSHFTPDPVLPPWDDLFDASGQATQVFESWRKEQGPIQTRSCNKFADGLENLWNRDESHEDALQIAFMFCNLLKVKGTPPSHPKLLELSQLYLTAHPEVEPMKLYNFGRACYNKYLTERKKDELHKVDTKSRQSFGNRLELLELSKAIDLVDKFKEAMAFTHELQKKTITTFKKLVLSFVECQDASAAKENEKPALALREELERLRRPDVHKWLPCPSYQEIIDQIRQIEETFKKQDAEEEDEEDAGSSPKRIKRK